MILLLRRFMESLPDDGVLGGTGAGQCHRSAEASLRWRIGTEAWSTSVSSPHVSPSMWHISIGSIVLQKGEIPRVGMRRAEVDASVSLVLLA